MTTKKNKKHATENPSKKAAVQNDSEQYEKKFNQSIGIENYNKTEEPVVSPPNEVKEKPDAKKEQRKERS